VAATLVLASVAVIVCKFFFFTGRRTHYFIFFRTWHSLPVNALIVVVVLDKLLKWHERQSMLKKMNIVIGVFFSEMGIRLLTMFSSFDKAGQEIRKDLLIGDRCRTRIMRSPEKNIKKIDFAIDARNGNLQEMHDYFVQQRSFVLALMENPNLLEHESFTDMLLAASHLMEELSMKAISRPSQRRTCSTYR